MADVKVKSEDTKQAFVFDKTKCLAHLTAVEQEIMQHAGKVGHNPYLWINRNIEPLRKAIAAGANGKDLQDKVLALKVGDAKV